MNDAQLPSIPLNGVHLCLRLSQCNKFPPLLRFEDSLRKMSGAVNSEATCFGYFVAHDNSVIYEFGDDIALIGRAESNDIVRVNALYNLCRYIQFISPFHVAFLSLVGT